MIIIEKGIKIITIYLPNKSGGIMEQKGYRGYIKDV